MSQVASTLASRGMKPLSELSARRDHGDRLRYMGGCRCFQCRRANTAYEAARKIARAAGLGNGIVPAAKARAHMKQLSALGVGRRSVGAASDVADSVLSDIITGRKINIRAATERAILAVTIEAAGDHALVPAKATWKLLDELIKDGFTRGDLAVRMGRKTRNLQLDKDVVTVRNAYLVERLHRDLQFTSAKATLNLIAKLRDEGYTQSQIEQRAAALAASLGEEVPSLVPNTIGRISMLAADLVEQIYREMTA